MRAAYRVAAPVAAGLMLIGTLAAPADANVRVFKDRRGDANGSVDVTEVRVDNSTLARGKVVVRIKQKRFRYEDKVSVYFDTNAKRRGPEYRLSAVYASEYWMTRMKSWTKHGRPVHCANAYKLKMRGQGVSRAVVGRKCLGKPGRIRVAVRAHHYHGDTDWARGKHRWLGRVKR